MNTQILLTIIVSVLILSNLVLAVPGVPNQFYGTVTWNGSPAPDGTSVIAKINGVQVTSTTTKNGKYGYDPIFYVDDPNNNRQGKTINFFVNNVDTGQTASFDNAAVTRLDLSASGGTTQPPSGGTPPSGGVYIPPQTTNQIGNQTGGTTEQGCQERWVCQDWSTCKDGIQTRICTDANNCGTRNNEPLTSQPCSTVETGEETKPSVEGLGPTAFFLLNPTDWVIAIVSGIIIALIIIFLAKRRGSKKK
jgi:hypothetical protein